MDGKETGTGGADRIAGETAEPAPGWLIETSRGKDSGPFTAEGLNGFYLSYRRFSAVFNMRGHGQLVVAFDNLSVVRDRSAARDVWGAKLCREQGWSSLGILSFDANWYRDEELFGFLEDLAARGFFRQFERVSFIGTSMGGYAACAFAGLAPGAVVAAFSPQSTLKKALVPWEKRFNRGRKQDWSGAYADAAEGVQSASRAYLVYDPYVVPDRRHVERLAGPASVMLEAKYSGHRTVVFLRKAGILKEIMIAAVEGRLTPAQFYRAYRQRRILPWYVFALFDHAMGRGRRRLAQAIIDHHAAAGNTALVGHLKKRLAEAEAD